MDFEAPTCTYCRQMYSRFNEPIYIVCLCDDIAKYAHGSCFRDYLKRHRYGVCGHCLTKSQIKVDGYKSLGQWKVPTLKPFCGFWGRFVTVNRYYKIVYCIEEKVPKGVICIYNDVPVEIPCRETETPQLENDKTGYESEIGFEVAVTEDKVDSSKHGDEKKIGKSESGFKIPTVFVPRGYPYVKRRVEYEDESPIPKFGFDDQFEYYHTLDSSSISNRGNSWNSRAMRNSSRSVSRDFESSQSENSDNKINSNSLNEQNTNSSRQNESTEKNVKSSKFRNFINILSSDKTTVNKRNPSNNNTLDQFHNITDTDNKIAVVPLQNDVIFMPVDKKPSRNVEDNWVTTEPITSSKNNLEPISTKSKKKGKKVSSDTNLYGVSTSMFKPVLHKENAPEPIKNLNHTDNPSPPRDKRNSRTFQELSVDNLHDSRNNKQQTVMQKSFYTPSSKVN